jgi:hypothetical protein
VELNPTYHALAARRLQTGAGYASFPTCRPAEEFSVLSDELAHEMMHHDKAAAPLPEVVRETQAEAVAFVVCLGIGFKANNAAADYIALYHGDPKTLADSLAMIQQTSSRILDDPTPSERVVDVQEKGPGPEVKEATQPHLGQRLRPGEDQNRSCRLTKKSRLHWIDDDDLPGLVRNALSRSSPHQNEPGQRNDEGKANEEYFPAVESQTSRRCSCRAAATAPTSAGPPEIAINVILIHATCSQPPATRNPGSRGWPRSA